MINEWGEHEIVRDSHDRDMKSCMTPFFHPWMTRTSSIMLLMLSNHFQESAILVIVLDSNQQFKYYNVFTSAQHCQMWRHLFPYAYALWKRAFSEVIMAAFTMLATNAMMVILTEAARVICDDSSIESTDSNVGSENLIQTADNKDITFCNIT